uniref:Integrase core domain containing protein n=1 Tax=Solanum tuberosum TaxID=4113 RepID=M1DIY3_SOLTU
MEPIMDQMNQAVYKRLDAFELRILERPAPTIDLSIFHAELASLRANMGSILVPPESAPVAAPTEEVDTVVISVLFGDSMPPPDSSRAAGKRSRSDRTSNDAEAHRLRKKERQQIEEARRASIVDEELRQQLTREVGVGPSARVSTTEGAERVDERTTESAKIVDGSATNGIPSVDPVGSEKPDPPAS